MLYQLQMAISWSILGPRTNLIDKKCSKFNGEINNVFGLWSGSSRLFYAPLMPCVTRRTEAQGLTRPYNTVYAVKYRFFAQTSLIY
jgi:hypothetical protein